MVALGFALPAASMSVPLAPPSAAISASPNPALVGQTVTFDGSNSTGDGLGSTITKYEWDLDGDGTFELDTGTTPSATSSYTASGTIPVSLRVTDDDGDTDVDQVSLRVHRAPTAGFIFQPSSPQAGEAVTFSSTSSDPDGPLAGLDWDLDGDGQFDDASGQTATAAFPPGSHQVSLKATDADGATSTASRVVDVSGDVYNQGPEASFVFLPNKPRAGKKVLMTSTSTDPDGQIEQQSWDLDGDGGFDDATGPSASKRFTRAGEFEVGLRVTDNDGATDESVVTIRVRRRGLQLLSPFPIVRISGTVNPNGNTLLERLTVRGPKGTDVTVRCQGKSCPFKRRHRAIKHRRVGFPGIEHALQPGVVILVWATKADAIGKFTKLRIRKDKPPARKDSCVKGEVRNPIPCPRS